MDDELNKPLTEDQEIYKENILDHYKNPKNKKELKKYSVKHKETNILCGDEITMYIQIEKSKIKDISFTGKGCAISQASASMLTEKLKGMSIKEVKKLKEKDILKMLGIPLSFVRTKCALLSLKTVLRGLENEKA